MPSKGGLALKGLDTFLRILEFLCAALILGIFSWFLAYLHHHNRHIPTWMKACEGMSGAAVIYTAFAVILTCFLGGITFFAFLAILLDICFIGCFVAIAILARHGVHTDGAYSPLGNGKGRDAKLQTVAFAVAIIGAFLFLLTAAMALLLNRHHRKEKKYGPSPANNYTSGKGRTPFWKRKNRKAANRDAEELGTIPNLDNGNTVIAEEKARRSRKSGNKSSDAFRTSNETAMTGSTAAVLPAETGYGGANNKYSSEGTHPQRASGYYSAYQAPQVSTAPTSNTGYGYVGQDSGVIHDPNPYAEVHGTGHPHVHPVSNQGHGTAQLP